MSRSQLSLTPFEQLLYEANNDESVRREIADEKRVGLYRLKHKLGSGNFSEVKSALHLLTKEKVAVKILDKFRLDSQTQKLVTREMEIVKKVYHPHTVRFYEEIETISKLYIVMEYCACGDLHAKVTNNGKLVEKEARPIYAQIISAIDYLHSVHVVHRDIKAENVYFATPRFIKVGDFGFSTFASKEDALSTFCGSPPYAAPELLKDQSYDGTQVDVWALGVLLYFMVTSVMPFRADNFARLKSLILAGQYSVPGFLSESCVTLLRSALRLSPKDRITISQIKKCAWLEDQEFVLSYDDVAPPLSAKEDEEGEEDVEEEDNGGEKRHRKHKHRHHRNRRSKEQEAAREAEVRSKMHEYGISDDSIDKQLSNVRSNVTGIYRLLIHRLEKQVFREADLDDLENSSNGKRDADDQKDEKPQVRSPPPPPPKSQKSSTCTVL